MTFALKSRLRKSLGSSTVRLTFQLQLALMEFRDLVNLRFVDFDGWLTQHSPLSRSLRDYIILSRAFIGRRWSRSVLKYRTGFECKRRKNNLPNVT